MEYRIVYRDLSANHLVDIQCNDETYEGLREQQDEGEIIITYDEREECYYGDN